MRVRLLSVQLGEDEWAETGDIAGSDGDEQVAGPEQPGQLARGRGLVRKEPRPPPGRLDGIGDELPGHSRDGVLPGRIDIEDDDDIGPGQSLAELCGKVAGA